MALLNGPRGPRIVLKPGEDGAFLYAGHLEQASGIAAILRAFALEAPELRNGVLFVTELWREGTGYHPKLAAVDIRTGIDAPGLVGAIVGPNPQVRYTIARDWSIRGRARLSGEFDIVFGRDVGHVDHIHGELDQKKRRRRR